MLLALAAAALGLAAFFVVELASQPARERKEVLARASRYGRSRPLAEASEDASFSKRALKPLMAKTARGDDEAEPAHFARVVAVDASGRRYARRLARGIPRHERDFAAAPGCCSGYCSGD